MKTKRNRTIFVVPCFLDGEIKRMEAFSKTSTAAEMMMAWVHWPELHADLAHEFPDDSPSQLFMRTQVAVDRSRYAGTFVYQLVIDDRAEPIVGPIAPAKR